MACICAFKYSVSIAPVTLSLLMDQNSFSDQYKLVGNLRLKKFKAQRSVDSRILIFKLSVYLLSSMWSFLEYPQYSAQNLMKGNKMTQPNYVGSLSIRPTQFGAVDLKVQEFSVAPSTQMRAIMSSRWL